MKKHSIVSLIALCITPFSAVSAQTINVLYTTDIHGQIFNYDFVKDTLSSYSLSNAYTYISNVRDTAQNVILLDNGDFLQGTPAVYYYNFVDSASTHVMARIFNFMKYDAIGIGNHDIEATHPVYDKLPSQIDAPLICANIINTKTEKPYFQPYTIINRANKKIAIISLITPYVPHWLSESYWSGMQFDDMIESATYWVDYVKKNESPDAIIGLFHSGLDYTYANQNADTYKNENASKLVAMKVDGFDAILAGHDHRLGQEIVESPSGKLVQILDAGMGARNIGLLSLTFDKNGNPSAKGKIIATTNIPVSEAYNNQFLPQQLAVKAYTRRKICELSHAVESYESLAGSSAFTDVIHSIMLRHTNADISMAAPLLIDVTLPQGTITLGNLFSLYRYENTLCIAELSGAEVLKYLEYSYNMWITNPKENDHILNITNRGKLINKYYNMDSAAGIIYTVDVTKPYGKRISITSMADGSAFDLNKTYKVALNSYRANGGGGHLEIGVGIPFDKIPQRIIKTFSGDLRGLIINDLAEMGKNGPIDLQPLGNWKFIPEKTVDKYMPNDLKYFQNVSSKKSSR